MWLMFDALLQLYVYYHVLYNDSVRSVCTLTMCTCSKHPTQVRTEAPVGNVKFSKGKVGSIPHHLQLFPLAEPLPFTYLYFP